MKLFNPSGVHAKFANSKFTLDEILYDWLQKCIIDYRLYKNILNSDLVVWIQQLVREHPMALWLCICILTLKCLDSLQMWYVVHQTHSHIRTPTTLSIQIVKRDNPYYKYMCHSINYQQIINTTDNSSWSNKYDC